MKRGDLLIYLLRLMLIMNSPLKKYFRIVGCLWRNELHSDRKCIELACTHYWDTWRAAYKEDAAQEQRDHAA